jgi:hypothetical protein
LPRAIQSIPNNAEIAFFIAASDSGTTADAVGS